MKLNKEIKSTIKFLFLSRLLNTTSCFPVGVIAIIFATGF